MIRFAGMAHLSKPLKEGLKLYFPYDVEVDGHDLVIPDEECKKAIGSVIQYTNKTYNLKRDNHASIADDFITNYLNPLWELQPHNAKLSEASEAAYSQFKRIKISEKIDASELLDCINKIFMGSAKNDLKRILVDDIYPCLCRIDMKYVCFVGVEHRIWFITNIMKIMYMESKFGIDVARQKVLGNRALASVLPPWNEPLLMLEGFLSIDKRRISLPLYRWFSQMHCLGESPFETPAHKDMESYEILRTAANPFQAAETQESIALDLGNRRNEKYLFTCIEAVNSLYSYFLNLSVYTDDNDIFDFEKFIKAISSLHFLAIDLVELNYKYNSDYAKLRLTFSFIDKLANFQHYMKDKNIPESTYFEKYLSYETGKTCAKMLKYHFSRKDRELGNDMYKFALGVWECTYAKTKETSGSDNNDEEFILSILRTMRNTNHGGFLRGGNFEKAFFTGSPRAALEINFIPLILMLCLALDPEYFLEKI